MKIERNQKYFTISRYAVMTIVISALAIMVIFNFDSVTEKLSVITNVTTPIIIGIFCAYILNPLMVRLEKGMFGKWSRSEKRSDKTRARVLALTVTMLFVLSILILLVILVLPQLISNIVALFNNMDNYFDVIHGFIDKIAVKMPLLKGFLENPVDDLNTFISNI